MSTIRSLEIRSSSAVSARASRSGGGKQFGFAVEQDLGRHRRAGGVRRQLLDVDRVVRQHLRDFADDADAVVADQRELESPSRRRRLSRAARR